MIQAMCIKSEPWRSSVYGIHATGPVYGEIVTIVCQSPFYPLSWDLLEYPVNHLGGPTSWRKCNFIPLSAIDETELVNERERLLTV